MRRTSLQLAIAGAALAFASIGASVASPDPDQGRALFARRCIGCHDLDGVKAGPPLRGIFGKPVARNASYPYSDALKNAHLSWDEATLNRWLADPDALVDEVAAQLLVEDQVVRHGGVSLVRYVWWWMGRRLR